MAIMKDCPDCGGHGGDYPIVGTGYCQGEGGPYYPIEGDWLDCETCDGTGEVVDDDAYDEAELLHDPLKGVL